MDETITPIFYSARGRTRVRNTGDELMILLVVVSPPEVAEENLYINPLKRVTQVWEKEYR